MFRSTIKSLTQGFIAGVALAVVGVSVAFTLPSNTIIPNGVFIGGIVTSPLSGVVVTSSVGGGATNEILYQTAPNVTSFVPAANSGIVVTGPTGTPYVSSVLPNGATATTQPLLDSSNKLATTAFVQNISQYNMATIPLNLGITGGGTYSFASIGGGGVIVIQQTSGVITNVLTIPVAGSNYAVGDILTPPTTAASAVQYVPAHLIVTSVNGSGGITGMSVLNGGTGYQTGGSGVLAAVSSGVYTYTLTGALSSPATVLFTPGTIVTQSNQFNVNNNTTGGQTVTMKISGQSGGVSTDTAIGVGTQIIAGSNNAAYISTDGVTDVWCVSGACNAGIISTTSMVIAGSAVGACSTGSVTQVNGYSDSVSGMSSVVTSPTTTPVIDIQWVNASAVPISITGSAGSASNLASSSASDNTNYLLTFTSAAGSNPLKVNTSLTYNPASSVLANNGYSATFPISQTSIARGLVPSGYIVSASGVGYTGSEGAATTLTLSGGTYTAGTSGVTATCTGCFGGTTATDVGRVITMNNSGTLYTAAITAASTVNVTTVTIGPVTVPGGNLTYTAGNWGIAWPLPPVYANTGIYAYFPAVVVTAGTNNGAGLYWTVFGAAATTTAGPTTFQIYDNTYSISTGGDPIVPSSPSTSLTTATGAYTQVLTAQSMHMTPVSGGTLGPNAVVRISPLFLSNNTTNNKEVFIGWGGITNYIFNSEPSTFLSSWEVKATIRNMNSTTHQILAGANTPASGSQGISTSTSIPNLSINTTSTQNIYLECQLYNANDFCLDASSLIEVTP